MQQGEPQRNRSGKAGERKDFPSIGQNRQFKVVEIGYSPPKADGTAYDAPQYLLDDTFSKVVINESIENGTDRRIENNTKAERDGYLISEVNSYNFTNQIAQAYIDLEVAKNWVGGAAEDLSKVQFRIIRIDSVTGERKQVAIQDGTRKIRTFAIEKGDDREWSDDKKIVIPNLLSQYDNHYYTYEVEELNAPAGYVASYIYSSADNDGSGSNIRQRNATIKNVNNDPCPDFSEGTEFFTAFL